MTARLPAHLEVASLLRRVEAAGGSGVVLAKGDRDGGAILVVATERGILHGLIERRPDARGGRPWTLDRAMVDSPSGEIEAYFTRRRARDPDLWIVELDIVGVERFAAELIAAG